MTRTDLIDELVSQTVGFRPYGFDRGQFQHLIFNQPEKFLIGRTGYLEDTLLIGIPTSTRYLSNDDAIDHMRNGGEFLVAKVLGMQVDDVSNCITVNTAAEFIDYWSEGFELSAEEASVKEMQKNPNVWLDLIRSFFGTNRK